MYVIFTLMFKPNPKHTEKKRNKEIRDKIVECYSTSKFGNISCSNNLLLEFYANSRDMKKHNFR